MRSSGSSSDLMMRVVPFSGRMVVTEGGAALHQKRKPETARAASGRQAQSWKYNRLTLETRLAHQEKKPRLFKANKSSLATRLAEVPRA